MKITKEMLKQIIKEELGALNNMIDPPAHQRQIEKRKQQNLADPREILKLLKQAENQLKKLVTIKGSGWEEDPALQDLKKVIKSVARLGYSEKEVATRTPGQKQVAQALEKGHDARWGEPPEGK